jgi:hypothetical protein
MNAVNRIGRARIIRNTLQLPTLRLSNRKYPKVIANIYPTAKGIPIKLSNFDLKCTGVHSVISADITGPHTPTQTPNIPRIHINQRKDGTNADPKDTRNPKNVIKIRVLRRPNAALTYPEKNAPKKNPINNETNSITSPN